MSWDKLKESSPEEIVAGVAGTKAKDMSSDGKLSRIEIDPSDNNGFTITHHVKPAKSTKENEPSHYCEPKKLVFKSTEDMLAYVRKATGGDKA